MFFKFAPKSWSKVLFQEKTLVHLFSSVKRCTKIFENIYFDQLLECTASKYTTVYDWFSGFTNQRVSGYSKVSFDLCNTEPGLNLVRVRLKFNKVQSTFGSFKL